MSQPLSIVSPAGLKDVKLPELSYIPEDPEAIRCGSAFVSATGLVLQRGKLHPRCAPNLSGDWDQTFGRQWTKTTRRQWLSASYGRSLHKEKLRKGTYGLIHSPWMNFYFWLCHSLPRLELLLEKAEDFTLLLPGHYRDIAYVAESLSAYPEVKVHLLDPGVHAQVADLLLAPSPRWSAEHFPRQLQLVRQRLLTGRSGALVKRLFLDRGSVGPRSIDNAQELFGLLDRHSIKAWQAHNSTFDEQITKGSGANFLIGAHGAGLSQMLFMPKGSQILELMPIAEGRRVRITYLRLAAALGHHYQVLPCSIVGQAKSGDLLQGNALRVPLEKLEKELARIFAGSQ